MKKSYISYPRLPKYLLIFMICCSAGAVLAQQNSVSIGTQTINDKAVLMLVSPAGNQGLIVPVVSSRTAVDATASEAGMVVFDQTDNRIYYWDGSAWIGIGGGGAGSDNWGTQTAETSGVVTGTGVTGDPIKLADGSTVNQILVWDGSQWALQPLSTGGTVTSISTGTGLTGGPITNSGTISIAAGGITNNEIADNTITGADISTTSNITASSFSGEGSGLTNINASSIQGEIVSTTTPTTGQVLQYNAGQWQPVTLSAGTGDITAVNTSNGITGGVTNGDANLSLSNTGSGQILVGDGTTVNNVAVSGDATLSSSGVLTLANSGVTAGTYRKVTVDEKGRVTSGAALTLSDIPSLPMSKISDAGTLATQNTVALNQIDAGGAAGGQVLQFNSGTGFWEPATVAISDNQTLTLNSSTNILTISNGNTADLSEFQQNLTSTASGTTRTISISGGTGTTIDIADGDFDATNEYQDLSLATNTLSLSNSAATIDLSPYLDNTDTQNASQVAVTPAGNLSSTDVQLALVELQGDIDGISIDQTAQTGILSGNGSTITGLVGSTIGNVLKWSGSTWIEAADEVNDADFDATNEYQDLSLATNTLSLSNSAATIDLSPYLDNTDTQTASQVAVTPTGNLASTDVQLALNELQGDVDVLNNSSLSDLSDALITAPADGHMLLYNFGNTQFENVPLGGDAVINSAGTLNIADDAITLSKIADNGTTRAILANNATGDVVWLQPSGANQVVGTDASSNLTFKNVVLSTSGGGTGIRTVGTAADDNLTSELAVREAINNMVGATSLADNTIPRANAGSFVASTIQDNGTNVSISGDLMIGSITPEADLHILTSSGSQFKLGHINQPTREWLFAVDAVTKLELINENSGTPATAMAVDYTGRISMGDNVTNDFAILSLNSTNKGLLLPRMTTTDRNSIAGGSPPAGLMIYNTTTAAVNYYNGSWVAAGADNLGNHTATTNLDMMSNAIQFSGAGTNTGITTTGANLMHFSDANIRLQPAAGFDVLMYNGTTEYARFDGSTQRLGIGTTTPGEALDVAGNIKASGFYMIGGVTVLRNEGTNSVFVGDNAGGVNIPDYATFVGFNAGVATTGVSNTFVGAESGSANTTGAQNAFFGLRAGQNNTSGNNNTFIGRNAGTVNDTGSNNTMLGYNANVTSGALTNATAVGYNASVSASNSLVLGNGANVGIGISAPTFPFHVERSSTSYIANINNTNTFTGSDVLRIDVVNATPATGQYFLGFYAAGSLVGGVRGDGAGGIVFDNPSDRRLKENIKDLNISGISTLMKIRLREYNYIGKEKSKHGFIAQELAEVYPNAVGGDPNGDHKINPMTVAYSELIPLLVKGVQEQQDIINKQKSEIEQLKQIISSLEDQDQNTQGQLDQLKAQMDQLRTMLLSEAKKDK